MQFLERRVHDEFLRKWQEMGCFATGVPSILGT